MSVSIESMGGESREGQAGEAPLLVTCLCAAWCGVCNQFRPQFEALAARYPQLRFAWLDVEDREDIMGNVDVETFPTVLLSSVQQVLFFGPVLPQAGVLQRMLDAAAAGSAPAAGGTAEAQALLSRILQAEGLQLP